MPDISPFIIAVDPGVVTGIALWWPESGELLALELPEDDAMDTVEKLLNSRTNSGMSNRTIVVCEDFVPRGGALTWYPQSLHQIGYLKHLCRKRKISFRLQQVKDR